MSPVQLANLQATDIVTVLLAVGHEASLPLVLQVEEFHLPVFAFLDVGQHDDAGVVGEGYQAILLAVSYFVKV